MAKGFDTLHLKDAVKTHSKNDLSFDHLSTFNFGQIVPLAKVRTIPGDKFNVNAQYFSRLAPLVKPTYGKFSFRVLNGFVPVHQIAYDGEAWINGNATFEGTTPTGRWFTMLTLHQFITNYCVTTTGATATNSQYTYMNASDTVVYNLFTKQGRYWVKILNALGYALPESVKLKTTSNWYTNVKDTHLNALPLLGFFKLYNDYMSQSTRFNVSVLTDILRCVKLKISTTGYTPATGEIAYTLIAQLFNNIFLNYDNDYFTSAWQNPNDPTSYVQHISTVYVPSGRGEKINNQTTNTFFESNDTDGTYYTLTKRAADMLNMFDSWVKRNNYSGSRAVQQIYSRFGIKTDDYKSHYAHILSTDVMPVQVGDVTSTSDTTGAILGDYAGKGIMSGNKGFSVEVSDYGYIYSLGYFTVIPMNPYGFDRDTLSTDPFDFYTPEFDGLGAEAIPVMEYFEDCRQDPTSDGTLSTDVFGFTERYNSYRFGRDMITGDFRTFNASDPMNTWHTGRNMGAIRQTGSLIAQSTEVNCLAQYDSEYNRIFSITNDNVDHFYLTAHFDISAMRPIKNLNQVVGLGEGDTVIPRNGNTIS